MEGAFGIEPKTRRLKVCCSTSELSTRKWYAWSGFEPTLDGVWGRCLYRLGYTRKDALTLWEARYIRRRFNKLVRGQRLELR